MRWIWLIVIPCFGIFAPDAQSNSKSPCNLTEVLSEAARPLPLSQLVYARVLKLASIEQRRAEAQMRPTIQEKYRTLFEEERILDELMPRLQAERDAGASLLAEIIDDPKESSHARDVAGELLGRLSDDHRISAPQIMSSIRQSFSEIAHSSRLAENDPEIFQSDAKQAPVPENLARLQSAGLISGVSPKPVRALTRLLRLQGRLKSDPKVTRELWKFFEETRMLLETADKETAPALDKIRRELIITIVRSDSRNGTVDVNHLSEVLKLIPQNAREDLVQALVREKLLSRPQAESARFSRLDFKESSRMIEEMFQRPGYNTDPASRGQLDEALKKQREALLSHVHFSRPEPSDPMHPLSILRTLSNRSSTLSLPEMYLARNALDTLYQSVASGEVLRKAEREEVSVVVVAVLKKMISACKIFRPWNDEMDSFGAKRPGGHFSPFAALNSGFGFVHQLQRLFPIPTAEFESELIHDPHFGSVIKAMIEEGRMTPRN